MAKPSQKHDGPSDADKEVLARWDEFLEVVFKNTKHPSGEDVVVLKFWNVPKEKRAVLRNAIPGISEYCPSLSLKSKKIEIKFQKTEMPYDNLVVWEVVGLSKRDTEILRHYLQEKSNLYFFKLSSVRVLSPYVRSSLAEQRAALRVLKGEYPKIKEG